MSRKTTRRPRVSIRTRDLMAAFRDAAEAKAWRGGMCPEGRAETDCEYRKARAEFVGHLVQLEVAASVVADRLPLMVGELRELARAIRDGRVRGESWDEWADLIANDIERNVIRAAEVK